MPSMTQSRTYVAPDISCDHCKNAIENGLNELTGITEAVVDVQARSIRVVGDVDDATLRSALDDLGYPVASPADPTDA